MNNSLKTINTLATIISLEKPSNIDNIQVKQSNTDNILVKQLNTEQPSINNTLIKQSSTDNTKTTLPKWLKDSKCIINPLNTDNKSFQYSVALSRHKEMGLNCNRINKIKPFLQHFNF